MKYKYCDSSNSYDSKLYVINIFNSIYSESGV